MPNEVALQYQGEVLGGGTPTGGIFQLGTVETRPYQRIRVFVRVDGTVPAQISMSYDDEGIDPPGLLDEFKVVSNATVQQVYEVPGQSIIVAARPVGDTKCILTLVIWGYRLPGE